VRSAPPAFPLIPSLIPTGLIAILLLLPLSDGGRTSFARAMLAAGVFLLIALLLVGRESAAFVSALPLRWLALAGLVIVASLFRSIFKDFSVKDALVLSSVIGAAILAGHVARHGHRRPLTFALLGSGVLASLLAVPAYLAAPAGSQAASALSGSFHYPNGLASFLLLTVFLPFTLIFHGRTRLSSLASTVILAVLAAGLVLTYSRGAWAAGLLALSCWILLERRLVWTNRRYMALAALLTLTLVLVATRRPAAEIAPRLASLTEATSRESPDPSFQWRQEIYAWTIDIVRDHPWSGTGIGTFPIAIKLYQRVPYVTGLYAHSHYLQTAAEMGLPGLAALLLVLGVLFGRGRRIIGSLEPQSPDRSLAVGLAAGLLGSSVHAAVDFGWSYPAVALVLGVEAAMLLSLGPSPPEPATPSNPDVRRLWPLRLGLLTFCLVVAGTAGTRYYAEFLRSIGKAALDADEPERAINALRWASRLNPLSYSPRQLLAHAYGAQGDVTGSQREAEAAFRLDRHDGDAYYELARIRWRAGRYEEAESAFLSAVRILPYTRLVFYSDLGEFLLATDKVSDARTWLEKGIEIFRPETVLSAVARCLAPGDRYLLAGMYHQIAELSLRAGRVHEARRFEEVGSRLDSPSMEEICFRAMTGRLRSPESTIVAYWESRRVRDWPGVIETFASAATQRLKDESLVPFPANVQRVRVERIVRLTGNDDVARVAYEVTVESAGGAARRAAFRDSLIVERGGWKLRHREPGLS
jgi:O-antigen ligase